MKYKTIIKDFSDLHDILNINLSCKSIENKKEFEKELNRINEQVTADLIQNAKKNKFKNQIKEK